MLRNFSRCRITVSPVFVAPSRQRTFDTSTFPAANRPTAICPRESSPMREMKPTLHPSAAKLCAAMDDELPSVSIMRSARSSRSGGSSGGKPYRMRSRFSSPAMVTSNCGMFRSFGGVLVSEHNYAAQIAWLIGVQTLFESGVETHQLPGDEIEWQSRLLRTTGAKFDQQIGSGACARVRMIRDDQRGATQLLDLFQNLEFFGISRLGKKECDQGILTHNRLGPVTKFQGVKALRVRN